MFGSSTEAFENVKAVGVGGENEHDEEQPLMIALGHHLFLAAGRAFDLSSYVYNALHHSLIPPYLVSESA